MRPTRLDSMSQPSIGRLHRDALCLKGDCGCLAAKAVFHTATADDAVRPQTDLRPRRPFANTLRSATSLSGYSRQLRTVAPDLEVI